MGPAKAELLKKELGIFRYADLLQLYPYRYVDRSRFYQIQDLAGQSAEVQIIGQITSLSEERGKGRNKRLKATFTDGEAQVELVWFKGAKWIAKSLKTHQDYVLYGRPSLYQDLVLRPSGAGAFNGV